MVVERNEVLARLNVEQLMVELGVVVKSRSGAWLDCLCPLHDDGRPSFRICTESVDDHEKGFWICHAEGRHGSVFDLVIAMGRASTFLEAAACLGAPIDSKPAARAKPQETRQPRKAKPSVVSPEQVEWFADCLWGPGGERALRYLRETRGLSERILREFQIGYREKPGAIVIPKGGKEPGNPQHLKFVVWPKPEDNSPRFLHSKGADLAIWPAKVLDYLRDERVPFVMIVESELDAMLILDLGCAAVATGGTSHFTLKHLASVFETGSTPVLFADTDEAGQEAQKKLVEQLRTEALPYALLTRKLPEGCKDIGDIVRRDSLEKAREWLLDAVSKVEVFEPRDFDPKVHERLECYTNQQGETIVRRTLKNLDAILELDERWGRNLWMNELGRVRMIGNRWITDDDFSDIRMQIETSYGVDWHNDNVIDRVKSLCRRNARNPVREYLVRLAWDGVPRLDFLAKDHMNLSEDQDVALKSVYLRKFFIGAVARVFSPGCKMDTMLVLYSKDQGIGKSRFAACLAGEWFCDESIRPDERDCRLALHKNWIVEVSELDATTRKRDVAELRAFLSKSEDLIRPPYGRCDELFRRQFVFIGTTNDQGVVKECDGRRYWPIEVVDIDVEAVAKIRDQLWAEAVAAFAAGEKWWLDVAGDARRREDTKLRFMDTDAAVDLIIERSSDPIFENADGFTMTDVLALFADRKVVVSRREVPSILRAAGFQPKSLWIPRGADRSQQKCVKRWVRIGHDSAPVTAESHV